MAKHFFRPPGYTQIPDEIFDELMPKLSGSQLKVLLYIARRTLGFHRESDSISLDQICNGIETKAGKRLDGGTGLARHSVIDAIEWLSERGYVVAEKVFNEEKQQHFPTVYKLNIEEGGGAFFALPPSAEIAPGVVQKLDYPFLQETVDTKESFKNPLNPPLNEELKIQSSDGSPTLDTGSGECVAEVLRLYRGAKGAKRLTAKERESLKESIAGLPYSGSEITLAMEAFLGDDYWREKQFPVTAFVRQIGKYVERGVKNAPEPELGMAIAGQGSLSVESETPSPTPSTSRPETEALIVEKYQSLNPEGKWVPRYDLPKLKAALKDEDFRQNWEHILEQVVALNFTLQWALKEKDGYPNWMSILNGSFNWKIHQKNGKETEAQRYIRELLAEEAEEQEQHQGKAQ